MGPGLAIALVFVLAGIFVLLGIATLVIAAIGWIRKLRN